MKKAWILLFLIIPLFGFSQSKNLFKAGMTVGMTPYLLEYASVGKGYEIQYERILSKKWSVGLGYSIINNKSNLNFGHNSFQEQEKSIFLDINAFRKIFHTSLYTLKLGLGYTYEKNNYDYIELVNLRESPISHKRNNSKSNVSMFNFVVENQFIITKNIFVHLKGIIRRQFPEGNVLTRKILYETGSSGSSLVLTGNYNLVLGVGYRF